MQVLTAENLVASVLQVAALSVATALALAVLKVRSPRIRLGTWRLMLVLAVAMPFIQPWTVTTIIIPDARVSLQVSVTSSSPSFLDAVTAWVRAHALPVALVSGCALRVLWMCAGAVRLRSRMRKSVSECDASAVQAELGTRAAVYYLEGIQQPATCGWLRPVVLLPAHLRTHDAALIRAVLVHELLHVKRGDWIVLVGEELVRALHWFNPAIWWLVDRVQPHVKRSWTPQLFPLSEADVHTSARF